MDKEKAQRDGKQSDTAQTGPAPYNSAAFKRAAKLYFAQCDSEGKLYSEAGLCLCLQGHRAGKPVTPRLLRAWYDDDSQPALRDAVRSAYLQMQQQIETDPRYWEKSAMASRATQLLSQRCFGGAQQDGAKEGPPVQLIFNGSVESSDFQ